MLGSNKSKGFVFYGVPQLFIEAANLARSESDFLVKIAKLTGNSNITHDQQLFRNIRAGKASTEDLRNFFNGLTPEKKFNWKAETEIYDIKTLGDWYHVHCQIDGLLQSSIADERDMKYIFNFIDAHCQIERQFLTELLDNIDIGKVADYLCQWLFLDKEVVTSKLEHHIIFEVRLCLYWSVIIEKLLNTWGNNQYSNFVPSLLPTFKADKNEFIVSTEKLLENVKKAYEKEYHSGKNKPWTHLYRHIAVKKQQDPRLGKDYIFDQVDPDVSAIKKQFDRWKKGELLSYDAFRKNLVIICRNFDDSKRDLEVFLIYLLCNMLTVVQKRLFIRCNSREDTDQLIERIVDEFAKIPEVRELIERRYKHFLSHGILTP